MPRGSCTCGSYTFEVLDKPDSAILCHCIPCQKQAGVNGSVNAIIPSDAYKILSGSSRTFTRKGESGKDVTNHACKECGTLMRVEAGALPGMLIYKCSTLDGMDSFENLKPVSEIFTRNRPDCFAALDVSQSEGAPS